MSQLYGDPSQSFCLLFLLLCQNVLISEILLQKLVTLWGKDIIFGPQRGSDWRQMGRIQDFFLDQISVHFGSTEPCSEATFLIGIENEGVT